MKKELLIQNNLNVKLGILTSMKLRPEAETRLIEHIRMLDWVLNDGEIRDIEVIVKEVKQ